MSAQKKTELFLLERLREKYPDLFDLPFIPTEEPDFVTLGNPPRVGLELTRFVQAGTVAPVTPAREAFLDKITARAYQILSDAGVTGVYVSFAVDLADVTKVKNLTGAVIE